MLAGRPGFYMVVRLDLWDRFRSLAYWWMHAMVAVWLLFTLMQFVAEPLFLDRWLRSRQGPAGNDLRTHRAAALDPVGSEPDHFDRRRSRQPRGADHRLSAPRATAADRLCFQTYRGSLEYSIFPSAYQAMFAFFSYLSGSR